jgi:DNA gyrase/topoisomerase IV subunit A
MTGKYEIKNTTTIIITELPVGQFVDGYKDHLAKLEEQGHIKDWEDRSSEESFEFIVQVAREVTQRSHEDLLKLFKLVSRDTENFTIWNKEGVLQRFESAEAVLTEFIDWRTGFYEVRRQRLIADTREQIRFQSEVIRFIRFYLANTKVFRDTSKKDLIELMLKNSFDDYDRLLSLAIWNLTKDKITELEKKLVDLKAYCKTLEDDTAVEMYRRELKSFKYDENLWMKD